MTDIVFIIKIYLILGLLAYPIGFLFALKELYENRKSRFIWTFGCSDMTDWVYWVYVTMFAVPLMNLFMLPGLFRVLFTAKKK